MCGRNGFHARLAALSLPYGVPFPEHAKARYDVAPGQSLPLVRVDREGKHGLRRCLTPGGAA